MFKIREQITFLVVALSSFIIFSLNFRYYGLESLVNFVLYFIIICLPFSLLVFNKVTIISPSFLITLAISMYELPKFPYYLDSNVVNLLSLKSHIYSVSYFPDSSIYYLSYTLLVCVFLFIFEFLILRTKKNSQNISIVVNKALNEYLTKTVFLCLGISTLYFLFVSKSDYLFLLSSRGGNEQAEVIKKESYFFIVIIIYSISILPGIIINKGRKYVSIFIFSSSLLYLYTGSRGFVVYGILSCLISWIYTYRKVPYKFITISLVIISLSFSLLGIVRKSTEELSLDNIKEEISSQEVSAFSSYQLQMRDELIFYNIDKIDDFYLSSVFSPVLMLLPRSLIGDLKPNMIDGELATKVWGRDDIGLPINLSTELIINFGFFGFLFLFPLIAFLLYLKDLSMRYGLIYFYISLMVFSQTFLSSKLVYTIQIIVIFFVFYFLYCCMKRIRKVI